MKKSFLLISFLVTINLFSQDISLKLKSGEFNLEASEITLDNSFMMLFFSSLPAENSKIDMADLGVDFLYYLPENIFVVHFSNEVSFSKLSEFGVISVNPMLSEYKIDSKLKQVAFPKWSVKNNLLFIKVLVYNNITISSKIENFRVLSESIEDVNEFSKSVIIAIEPDNLNLIADLSFVSYIEPIDPPSKKENNEGRTLHRSNVINTNFSTGRHYDGSGINVMMQDDGVIGPHIDYNGRVDQSNCSGCSTSNSNDHGDHVAGTIMGAGNIDPQAAGMANGAFLYVFSSSNNNYYDIPTIYQSNDVIITSKSYSNGCNAGYTSLSKDLDEQILLYPSLIHIFSAGNDGNSDCGYGAGSGWGNVTGGHKQGKNVIAVANLNSTGNLASSSSRGPAADGRIKPDIASKGTSVWSTIPPYSYDHFTGTSMACPGIAGIMAQLYQAYKELNGGINPPSSLMKCILLNSADDIGNVGPDFQHGWGEVNAYRAVKLLEDGNYFIDSISQLGSNSHTISIPSGVNQVKIMTYWHDKEANTSSVTALVNDINSSLSYLPLGINYDPLILDPTPNQSVLNSLAIPGTDNLNNMEQIVIENPIQGNYTLNVHGFSIPYGPQKYAVTYEFITDEIELTYPIGGEGFVPGETEILRWDASVGTTAFTLEYSIDGGSVWNIITSNVNADDRHYSWSVPNTITDLARIRVARGSFTSESVENFTIVGVPQNISVDWICPDSIYVVWNSVSGATSYEVSMLGDMYMDSMTTTNALTALIINPNPSNIDSWFSVCAKVNDRKGRRAIAINAQSLTGCCKSTPITYNDTSFTSPATFTLTTLASSAQWHVDTLGSVPIAFGDTFITPLLSSNTTYYVREFAENSAFGGALDTNIGNGSYYNGTNYLIFDSYTECTLVSADVYSQQSNTITFELRDNSSLVLQDTTITVSSGKQTLFFNFDIPVDTGLQLGLDPSSSGLYRNNNGAVYPYNISNLVSFTGGSNNSTQNNWYTYYNLEFKETCISQFADATAVFITPESIQENNQVINIFPNPAESKCTITANHRIEQIRVFDISARLCILQRPNSNATVLDVYELSKGIYVLELITEKETFKRQLIIQ